MQPEIYIIRWRGHHVPRTNRIQSAIRKKIDKRVNSGQIVFLLTEDEKVYEWRQWGMPIFTSWIEFHAQYKDYTMEIE